MASSCVSLFVLAVVLCTATLLSSASPLTIAQLLTQDFRFGILTDTYGSFNATAQLQPSPYFDGAFRHELVLEQHNVSDDSVRRVPATIEVDVSGPMRGEARLFFGAPNANAAADIQFQFEFAPTTEASGASSGPSTVTRWEATGRYTTNSISFGTYWWRFSSSSEFMLQLVDHVFTNTTTVHGFSTSGPEALQKREQKPWYQSWGMVLVTLGVFMIKTWLGVINAKRATKAERASLLAAKAKMKKNN